MGSGTINHFIVPDPITQLIISDPITSNSSLSGSKKNQERDLYI